MSESKSSRPIPPKENMVRVGAPTETDFIKGGDVVFSALNSALSDVFGTPGPDHRILDFGCGSGRVALPFLENYPVSLYCTDVDRSAIDFLSRSCRQCIPLVNLYDPPMPFADNFFDCVYSVSVWTHLTEKMQFSWLEEMKRITKKDAILLISTSGYPSLEAHHNRGLYSNVSAEKLRKKQFLFYKHKTHKKNRSLWPGVSGSYGLARHDPDYIRDKWSQYFDILEIREGVVVRQDLVILKNR